MQEQQQPVLLRPQAKQKWPKYRLLQNIRTARCLRHARRGSFLALRFRNILKVEDLESHLLGRTDGLRRLTADNWKDSTQSIMARGQQCKRLTKRLHLERASQTQCHRPIKRRTS